MGIALQEGGKREGTGAGVAPVGKAVHSWSEALHRGHVAVLREGCGWGPDAVRDKVAQGPVPIQVGGHDVEPRVVVAAGRQHQNEGAGAGGRREGSGSATTRHARQRDGLDPRRPELWKH